MHHFWWTTGPSHQSTTLWFLVKSNRLMGNQIRWLATEITHRDVEAFSLFGEFAIRQVGFAVLRDEFFP